MWKFLDEIPFFEYSNINSSDFEIKTHNHEHWAAKNSIQTQNNRFLSYFFCGDLKVTNGFRLDDQTKNRRFNKWIFEIWKKKSIPSFYLMINRHEGYKFKDNKKIYLGIVRRNLNNDESSKQKKTFIWIDVITIPRRDIRLRFFFTYLWRAGNFPNYLSTKYFVWKFQQKKGLKILFGLLRSNGFSNQEYADWNELKFI